MQHSPTRSVSALRRAISLFTVLPLMAAMLSFGPGTSTALAATGGAAANTTEAVAGLVVTVADDTAEGAVAEAIAELPVAQSRSIPQMGVITLDVLATELNDVRAKLDAIPGVSTDLDAPVSADLLPNDPFFSQQAALPLVNLPELWDTTTGSSDVVVAVLDTGVSPIAELSGRLLPGHDFVNSDADASDDNGHGTEVASILAAAGNDNAGMAGACWGCRILPVKVLDSDGEGVMSTAAAGIVWATDQGADIINLSLGGPTSVPVMQSAIDYAHDHDVLVVASAGNEGTSALIYPAALDGVLGVAGSKPDGSRESGSSYGAWVDVAAPWTAVAAKPDGSYVIGGGTSFSSPFVSGVAALLLSAQPEATASALTKAVQLSADQTAPTYTEFGLLDAPGALAKLPDAMASTEHVVVIDCCVGDFAIEPSELTINVGDSVRWEDHQVSSLVNPAQPFCFAGDLFAGACIGPQETLTRTFTTPGEYVYYTHVFSFIDAKVIVLGDPDPDPDPTPTPTPSPTPTDTPGPTSSSSPTPPGSTAPTPSPTPQPAAPLTVAFTRAPNDLVADTWGTWNFYDGRGPLTMFVSEDTYFARATGCVGGCSLTFYAGPFRIGPTTNPNPSAVIMRFGAGDHVATVVARDEAGRTATAQVPIHVSPLPAEASKPASPSAPAPTPSDAPIHAAPAGTGSSEPQAGTGEEPSSPAGNESPASLSEQPTDVGAEPAASAVPAPGEMPGAAAPIATATPAPTPLPVWEEGEALTGRTDYGAMGAGFDAGLVGLILVFVVVGMLAVGALWLFSGRRPTTRRRGFLR